MTQMFCDLEAAPGPAVNPAEESNIDGADYPGGAPNALWDDGGYGGACHVATYDYTPFNDPGCPGGDYAMAEDAAVGDSVEIAAACDLTTPVGAGIACGSDGVPDFLTFGEGGGHADPFADSGPYNEDGVPYPLPPIDSTGTLCLANNGAAEVFTLSGVRSEVPSLAAFLTGADGIGVSLSAPTVGWISQVTR